MGDFNDYEKKILEVFVTSATDHIYAIKSTVPPEVFGAFGSYFSRNPKDFRQNLLDAVAGSIEGEETEGWSERNRRLAHGDYWEPSEALKSGIAKSQDFFRKWYGKYSHKSIANTVWIPMVATNVSQLFARELAYDQLAFFIEQSTRFVKFDASNMFHDPDIMASQHKQTYLDTLEVLAKSYDSFTEQATEYYTEQMPFDSWLKLQDGGTLKSGDKIKEAKYNREMKAKALDVARFLLPQAIKTNIAWILDARSTEFDIAAWKGHPLREIREDALLIEKHAGQIAPSLLKYTEVNSYYADNLNNYGFDLGAEPAKPFEKGVDIISYESDALDKVLAHIYKRHNHGGTFAQRYEQVKKMSFDQKINVLRRVTKGRDKHDEWVEMDEDFDLAKTTLEIRTDIGAIRDWRRHQKWDRGEPLYTLGNGFHRPYMVADMPQEAGDIFDKAMEVAHNAEKKIRNDFLHQVQYLIPMAANHAITMSSGLDQLQYMLYTRSTPQGNFSYRKDAFNIAEAVAKIYPWILGYEKYPEGKDFEQAYREAPLKNLLILQLGETGLHQ